MGKIINPGIVVSFANQKGGVGKSVITSIVANYIHNNYANKIKEVVADADDLQASLYTIRQNELENIEESREGKLYRLIQISSNDIPDQIDLLQEEFDIIFFDLPGNLKQPGVITAYHFVDVIISPTQSSPLDIDSTIKFYNLYSEIIEDRKNLGLTTDFYAVFSRVDPQNKDFKALYENKDQLQIKFLDNYIPESKVAFQRNVSTLNTYENKKYDDYSKLCEEILTIILTFAQNEKRIK